MTRFIPIVLLAGILGFVSCDFPSDPPLRPVKERNKYLIDLKEGYRYSYFSQRTGSSELQQWTDTVQIATAPSGDYFRVRYWYLDYSDEKPEFLIMLGTYWRVDDEGLEIYFYQFTRFDQLSNLTLEDNPQLYWKFPYPAEVGAEWQNPNPDWPWIVKLVAKDTLVTSTDDVQTARCDAYNIYLVGPTETKLYVRLYFVPGEALFKIESFGKPALTAITYFWSRGE